MTLSRAFDAGRKHGTMLPSRRPLNELQGIPNAHESQGEPPQDVAEEDAGNRMRTRGTSSVGKVPVRRSSGVHITVRRKDKKAAERNLKTRQQSKGRSKYWGKA